MKKKIKAYQELETRLSRALPLLSPLVSCLTVVVTEDPFVIVDRGDVAIVDVVAVVVIVVEPGVEGNDVLESGNKVKLNFNLNNVQLVKSCDRGNGPCVIVNIYKHFASQVLLYYRS